MYPFKWDPNASEDPQPKDRTCCLVLQLGRGKNENVIVLPISDKPPAVGIEMTQGEIKLAGLSGFRRAFINVDYYNIDTVIDSYTFNPRVGTLGKLTKSLLVRTAHCLAENVRAGRANKIMRT